MNEEISEQIFSILSGQTIDIYEYPDGGFEDIAEPGYYYNRQALQIEHWSLLCDYNRIMASHFSNRNGIIKDGFQSVLAFEDITGLVEAIKNWNNHLIKYGVV